MWFLRLTPLSNRCILSMTRSRGLTRANRGGFGFLGCLDNSFQNFRLFGCQLRFAPVECVIGRFGHAHNFAVQFARDDDSFHRRWFGLQRCSALGWGLSCSCHIGVSLRLGFSVRTFSFALRLTLTDSVERCSLLSVNFSKLRALASAFFVASIKKSHAWRSSGVNSGSVASMTLPSKAKVSVVFLPVKGKPVKTASTFSGTKFGGFSQSLINKPFGSPTMMSAISPRREPERIAACIVIRIGASVSIAIVCLL